MNQPVEATLSTLDGGALMEQATAEIRRICANIIDPNASPDAKRTLTIKLTFAPDSKSKTVAIDYLLKSTLPAPEAGRALVHLGMDGKEVSIYEPERHPGLFPEKTLPALVPLDEKRA